MPTLCRLPKFVMPLAAILWALVLGAQPARAQEFRVGIFFDPAGQSCVGELGNFETLEAWVLAIVPAGTELNGAVFGVDLPPGLLLHTVTAPKDAELSGDLDGQIGLNVTLTKCPVAAGPIALANLVLQYDDLDLPSGARVPDIQLLLRGGVVEADSLSYLQPQVKICPDDPLGGEPELVEALSLRATLNCTSNCPCETSVVASTWGWVKSLFREP